MSLKTQEELVTCVGAVCRVIGSIPAFQVFEKHVAPGAPEEKKMIRDAIHNATLDSLMLHARCLNEFFTPYSPKHKPHPDDVRACDFPSCQMTGFLEKDELEFINKQLAHMTTSRVAFENIEVDANGIVNRALAKGKEFLEWVLQESGLPLGDDVLFCEMTINFCDLMQSKK